MEAQGFNTDEQTVEAAAAVLRSNDLGGSTKPTARLYPHQWLWDSCFIAIGLRHGDPSRAKQEIVSLFRGQWDNGMLPNMIFSEDVEFRAGAQLWGSSDLEGTPKSVETSCITQPPMVAEAVVRVGATLPADEKLDFYRQVLPGLVKYHQWFYDYRDPDGSGLVSLIHGWECGMDDLPYWSRLMEAITVPDSLKQAGRPDLAHASAEERPTDTNYFALYHLSHRIREHGYDLSRILAESDDIPVVQDVIINAILIRANQLLVDIAAEAGYTVSEPLRAAMAKTSAAFEGLYEDGMYWSRDYRTGQLVKEASIAGLMALYTGTVPSDRAETVLSALQSKEFWPQYGITSTPTDSPYFSAVRFWHGPVWINSNWLLVDGLERSGYPDVAGKLRQATLELVTRSGQCNEYYSALDGRPAGAANFSWTAALAIDLLKTRP